MKEENIQKLIDYIKQNQGMPFTEVMNKAIKEGFSREEIEEALERSQRTQETKSIKQPSTTESQVQNKKATAKGKLVVITISVFIFLLIASVGTYFYAKQNSQNKNKPTPNNKREELKQETPKINSESKPKEKINYFGKLVTSSQTKNQNTNLNKDNPMGSFFKALSSKDYKVSMSGKIENKTAGENIMQESSLDLNGSIVIVQKGEIVKAIKENNPEMPETYIMEHDNIYILDPSKKEYLKLSTNEETGKFMEQNIRSSFPLIPLVEDTETVTVTWERLNENEWTAKWKWKSPLDPEGVDAQVKIRQDNKTNLIDEMSIKFGETEPWQTISFKYEVVQNLQDLLKIPSDYKEVKL